jgi:hypothetical protein
MITDLWFYSAYPFFAAICCLWLLYRAVLSSSGTVYIKLFFNLAIMNLCQVPAYFVIENSFDVAVYAADAYLIAAYFLFSHFMQLAIHLSGKDRSGWAQWTYFPPVILTILHFSGFMVEGYRLENKTILHNDGVYAMAFDLFILLASIITISIFIINSRNIKQDSLLISKNIIAVISFIPFVLVAMLLIVLSNTKYVVPVVLVAPSMTLYIVTVFHIISKLDFSMGLGLFYVRLKLAWDVLKAYKTQKDLKRFYRAFEKELIIETLRKNDNHIKSTADHLQVNHTTLRGKIKEYNI